MMILKKSGCTVLAMIGLLCVTSAGVAQCRLKNVILMIGDGMGINQITATNCWQGVSAQAYQSFPIRVYQSTFAFGGSYDPDEAWLDFGYVMEDYTDSAPAASAMSTGFKVADGQINVDPIDGHPLLMYQTRAEELGKATGVVTSVQWSHATPAAFGAHNVSRSNYGQIAQEMMDVSGLDVIMGCGHPLYDNNHLPTSADYNYIGGQSQWDSLVAGLTPYVLIQTRAEFQALASGGTPERVCGTAQCRGTLQQGRTVWPGEDDNGNALPFTAPLNSGVPTLVEMARAALNVLDGDPDGFSLMIEGGAIDWACHANQKGRMIEEQIDFNNAVAEVISWVESNSNWNETLLIITGDHETGYLWGEGSGYPAVFNPIVSNGPGALPDMWFHSGSHTNSLIPVFAKGVGAAWFSTFAVGDDPLRGPYSDNTDIAHVILGYYDCTLPVELIAFTATAGDGEVILDWRTASESDNSHFEITRDGVRLAEVRATNSAAGAHYSWKDERVTNGVTYTYALACISLSGSREELGSASATPMFTLATATRFELHQNYPNPFNAATTLAFDLAERGFVHLAICNLMGQEVADILNGEMVAGRHLLAFDASALSSGVYLCRLEVNGFVAEKKMLMLK